MRVFRIVLRDFGATAREAFSGLSGYLADGRWHGAGRYLDYASQSLSLATLERLVHYKRFDRLATHVFFEVDVPLKFIADLPSTPAGWDGADLLPAAQALGNRWCDRIESPALKVPSTVTDGEFNVLLNARHPAWDWSWVSRSKSFTFDSRLAVLMKSI